MRVVAFALAAFAAVPALAADFKVPPLTGPVVDEAGIIDAGTRERIDGALFDLRQQGGTQINVLTVKSLEGLPIEEASIKVVEAWKLGGAKEDNGILLMVAPNERKVRIEVGQGLEGTLTDLDSKRIISQAITPLFKQGDMPSGILVGVYQIARKTNPDVNLSGYLDQQQQQPRQVRGEREVRHISPGTIIFFVIILIIMMSTSFGRAMLFGLFLSGLGGGRGGGGGGGGRGGWGGGGGGFSGGGASGDW